MYKRIIKIIFHLGPNDTYANIFQKQINNVMEMIYYTTK